MALFTKSKHPLSNISWDFDACYDPRTIERWSQKRYMSWYFKKLWTSDDNSVDELFRWQQADSILFQVQIRPISGIQNVNCSSWWRCALSQVSFEFIIQNTQLYIINFVMINEHYEPEIQDEQYLNPFHTLKNSSCDVHKVLIWDVGGPRPARERNHRLCWEQTLHM